MTESWPVGGDFPAQPPIQPEYSEQPLSPRIPEEPIEASGVSDIESIDMRPPPGSISAIDEIEEPSKDLTPPTPDPSEISNSNIRGFTEPPEPKQSTSRSEPQRSQPKDSTQQLSAEQREEGKPPEAEMPRKDKNSSVDAVESGEKERPDPLAPPPPARLKEQERPHTSKLPPELQNIGDYTAREVIDSAHQFLAVGDKIPSPETEDPTPENNDRATRDITALWHMTHALATEPGISTYSRLSQAQQTSLHATAHDDPEAEKRHRPPRVVIHIEDYSGNGQVPALQAEGQTILEEKVVAHIHIGDLCDNDHGALEEQRRNLQTPGCWAIAIAGDIPRLYRAHNSEGSGHTFIKQRNASNEPPVLPDNFDPSEPQFPIMVAKKGSGAQARALIDLLSKAWGCDNADWREFVDNQ